MYNYTKIYLLSCTLLSSLLDGLLLTLYSMGAGSIALIMALASCCLKRKAENFHDSKTPIIHNNKAVVEREKVDGRMRMTIV